MKAKIIKAKNIKAKIRKFLQFITNPRLLFCLALAWLITNGWSYILLAVGTLLGIGWMTALAGAYIAFLWVPLSPEKLVTLAIAIALLKKLFPDDQKTLAVLHNLHEKAKKAVKNRKIKKKSVKKKA